MFCFMLTWTSCRHLRRHFNELHIRVSFKCGQMLQMVNIYHCFKNNSVNKGLKFPLICPGKYLYLMMTSSSRNIFRVTGPLLGIHRSPVNCPHKGQWRGALKFSLICTWTNSWASNGDAGDLRRHRAHYDVIVMLQNTFHHFHIYICLYYFQ